MEGAPELVFDDTRTAQVTGTVAGGSAAVYSFWANEGDQIVVDIDETNGLDTAISIHAPGPGYAVDDFMDDIMVGPTTVLDTGSDSPADPYLTRWVPAVSGLYYVAVTIPLDRVADGGVFVPVNGFGSGGFKLEVSVATPKPADPLQPTDPVPTDPVPTDPVPTDPAPEAQKVRIDVRPGQKALVRLNPKWRESIPVAILSSRVFDARKINLDSLTFGRTGDEDSLIKCHRRPVHLNRDRRPDVVCHFQNQQAGFQLGDERAVLKGMTVDGVAFEGESMLKVLPEKKYKHKDHHHGNRYGHDHKKQSHSTWYRR